MSGEGGLERRGQISTHIPRHKQQIAGRASEQRRYSRTEPKPALSLDTKAGDTPLDTTCLKLGTYTVCGIEAVHVNRENSTA